MIRARVNIETAKNKYGPGDVIAENLSAADRSFLEKHNFITEEEETAALDMEETGETHGGESCDGYAEESGSEEGGIEYRDEAALNRMNKGEIVAYAAEIGLTLDEESLKFDLINAVLNYQEEKMAE